MSKTVQIEIVKQGMRRPYAIITSWQPGTLIQLPIRTELPEFVATATIGDKFLVEVDLTPETFHASQLNIRNWRRLEE